MICGARGVLLLSLARGLFSPVVTSGSSRPPATLVSLASGSGKPTPPRMSSCYNRSNLDKFSTCYCLLRSTHAISCCGRRLVSKLIVQFGGHCSSNRARNHRRRLMSAWCMSNSFINRKCRTSRTNNVRKLSARFGRSPSGEVVRTATDEPESRGAILLPFRSHCVSAFVSRGTEMTSGRGGGKRYFDSIRTMRRSSAFCMLDTVTSFILKVSRMLLLSSVTIMAIGGDDSMHQRRIHHSKQKPREIVSFQASNPTKYLISTLSSFP